MTVILQGLFWLCVSVVAYVYFGYPLLLLILSKLRPAPPVKKADITPTVSLIIPAYNEEKVIAQKIENVLLLDYPRDKLEIIIASDGSTDHTNKIVNTFADQGISLVGLNPNKGKSGAQNRAVAEAHGEIIFFTDANAMLQQDAVRKVVHNFEDDSVGCVVGKVTYVNEGSTSVSQGEGAYWRYELFLRRKERELGNLAMGSGPIIAIRWGLFKPLDPDVGEDFVLPIQTAINGYRVTYEPEAISEEILYQITPASMFRTKVRIIIKDLRGLFLCHAILNPFRYPLYAWGLVSHKLLRWLVPYFLIAIFAVNLLLLGRPLYNLILLIQIGFYVSAVASYWWQKTSNPPRILGFAFSFCLVNLAALVGVTRFLMGKRTGRWVPIR